MNPPDPNKNPLQRARVFARYVTAMICYLFWGLVIFGSLALAYVAARVMLVAVNSIMKAIGI